MATTVTRPNVKPQRDQSTSILDRLSRVGLPELIAYVLLTTWALLSLMPIYWMVVNSVKDVGSIITFPPELIPSQFDLVNYRDVFVKAPFARWILNSLVVTVTITGGQVLFCSMAGYSFAKKRFPGQNVLFWVLMASIMIPGWVTLIPLYVIIARLHWLDTYQGLIVPNLVGAWGMFLMKQFMQTLPTEFFDAARIDGASELGVFWQIVMPLSRPGLAVLGIFTFAWSWNDFLYPLLMTSKIDMRTIQVGMSLWVGPYNEVPYGMVMAGSTVAAVPMIVFFLLFMRHFLQGITLGGLKG